MWLWLCFWTGLEWVDQQLRHENNNNIVPQQSSLWKVTRVYVVLFSSGHSIYSCVCNQEFGSEKRRGGGQAFKKPAIATDSRDDDGRTEDRNLIPICWPSKFPPHGLSWFFSLFTLIPQAKQPPQTTTTCVRIYLQISTCVLVCCYGGHKRVVIGSIDLWLNLNWRIHGK